ncbi:TonB-dependent receptor domain-containing protein [Coralloluteibacterium stylophorae]|uniref:TonB-dependent receptor n=1 Tax=Coralloluteibacterium stylophorae TaxID=1776034 RepID=A0AAP2CDR3_9GAMM|nr:TonB-dependent receptor [Coralloluteibacterium stylophorae]MBS7458424.1 TonB-dependent receptor [Coralloluteibacterium stylophorae]
MSLRHPPRPALLVLACTLALPAAAQDAHELDRIVVTAARRAQTVDEALASVTVLDRAAIEASQAPDLIDLLGRQVGVDVARTGGPGSASSVFLRGGNSNHVLVLVDGVRVASTNQGGFDFANLPLGQIERIEIVRGPRAALWGSDAIGGVIHVFTRDPATPFAEARAGSWGRRGATAGVGIDGVRGAFGVVAGVDRLDGFSATTPDYAFGHDPDDDGYHNRNLSLHARTALGDSHALVAHALATEGDVEFDDGRTETGTRTGGVTLAGELGGAWSHSLALGHTREDVDTPVYGSRFESRRDSADWIHTLELDARNTLNLGLAWQRERGTSLDAFSGALFDRSRSNRAGFAAWTGHFGAHTFDLAARHDDNGQFGSADTGNAAWGWQPSDALRTRLSWGEGFRAPSFSELYYPDVGYGYGGNPELDPERSRTLEAGLDIAPAPGQRLGASVFRSRVDDLIAFAGDDFSAVNIDRAEIDGVELDYGLVRGPWRLDANATWQDAEDAGTGLDLLRRAGRKAHVGLGYRFAGGVGIGLDGDYVGERRDTGGSLPSFALAHLRLEWPLARDWRLEARVENLADRDYAWAAGYATPGRSGLVTLRWEAGAGRP